MTKAIMEYPTILYIKNHYLSINDKPIFSHKFLAFTNLKELTKYKRNYKFSYNSTNNKIKICKDLNKLCPNYTIGTSICNGKEFNWLRGQSTIVNEISGEYIYLDIQW